MDFFANYGLFFIKTLTLVLAILLVFLGIAAIASKNKTKQKGKITVKPLNDHFDSIKQEMDETSLSKSQMKLQKKQQKLDKKAQKQQPNASIDKNRLFVIDFHGDIRASAVQALRQEVTAILLSAKPNDVVFVRLDSPGGMVNAYGLAASQLQRIKQANLKLIISIDKVAASGGYMMACIGDDILAAPFAVVGSIGVVAQLPNFHRYLDKHHIDFEQITAGEYKRTLSVFGENTRKGRDKMQQDVDEIHLLFKNFIGRHRPKLNIEKVATGEYWYGTKALELQLIDKLQTSDDFLLQAKNDFAIFCVKYHQKKNLQQKLNQGVSSLLSRCFYQSNISQQDDLT